MCAKVCGIERQRHAATPITLMDILSHDQLRLVEDCQFPVPPPHTHTQKLAARQEEENKYFYIPFIYKIKFTSDHHLNSAKLVYYNYKDQLDELLQ